MTFQHEKEAWVLNVPHTMLAIWGKSPVTFLHREVWIAFKLCLPLRDAKLCFLVF